MIQRAFLDTNVLLRYFLNDHAEHSPSARDLMQAAAKGRISLWFTDTVVFETVFFLFRRRGVPRDLIREMFRRLLTIESIHVVSYVPLEDVFNLWVDRPKLSFADCMHALIAKANDDAVCVSFDKEFSKIPGVVRLEPDQILQP